MTQTSGLWPGDFYGMRDTLSGEDQALLAGLRTFSRSARRARQILNTEQAPAFGKETGIRIEITQLPIDALNARLRSEFASGGTEIDIVQWTNGWTGWVHRYLEDHKKLLAALSKITPDWDWNDFLAPANWPICSAGARKSFQSQSGVILLGAASSFWWSSR